MRTPWSAWCVEETNSVRTAARRRSVAVLMFMTRRSMNAGAEDPASPARRERRRKLWSAIGVRLARAHARLLEPRIGRFRRKDERTYSLIRVPYVGENEAL